jgi:hypothetical protein
VNGASSLHVPFQVLLYAVGIFIVIPLVAGSALRAWFIRARAGVVRKTLLPRFAPVSMLALLATLVLIFAFQADNITGKPFPRGIDRDSHPSAGLLQFVAHVWADAAVQGPSCRCRAGSADWRQQLLRTGRGDCHRVVRARFGSRPGYGGRRPHRGSGDAVGVRSVLQPDPATGFPLPWKARH